MLNMLRTIHGLLSARMQGRMKVICALIILGGFLEMLGIWLILPFVGYFAGSEDVVHKVDAILTEVGINERHFTAVVILAFLLFFVAKTFFLAGALFLQKQFAFSTRAEISSKLFECYLRRHYVFHTERHSGVDPKCRW